MVRKTIIYITRAFARTRLGNLIGDTIIEDGMQRHKSVLHNNIKMNFTVPNQLNQFRVNTFSEKEPETLEWIDTFPDNSTLWDIGANVGLYSIYAAKKEKLSSICFRTICFQP